MSWRTVCISRRAKLEYQMGSLVVRFGGNETTRVHLSDVGILILESTAISITSSLLCELVRRKIKVIFCDEKHNPHSEIIPFYGSHDTSLGIRKQIAWSPEIKQKVWTICVMDKIQMQALHLKQRNKPEQKLLLKYLSEVALGDSTNREGHAAKVYFNALFGQSFTRQTDCSINAALNYGYGIILSIFNREIVSNGRLTALGICHNNMFNHFNFSSDLMECFRPIVDRYVYDLNMRDKDFSKEIKHELLKMLEEHVVVGNTKQRMPNAIRIYVQKCLSALDSSDESLMASINYV